MLVAGNPDPPTANGGANMRAWCAVVIIPKATTHRQASTLLGKRPIPPGRGDTDGPPLGRNRGSGLTRSKERHLHRTGRIGLLNRHDFLGLRVGLGLRDGRLNGKGLGWLQASGTRGGADSEFDCRSDLQGVGRVQRTPKIEVTGSRRV